MRLYIAQIFIFAIELMMPIFDLFTVNSENITIARDACRVIITHILKKISEDTGNHSDVSTTPTFSILQVYLSFKSYEYETILNLLMKLIDYISSCYHHSLNCVMSTCRVRHNPTTPLLRHI